VISCHGLLSYDYDIAVLSLYHSLSLPPGLKREFRASSLIKNNAQDNYIDIDVGGKPYLVLDR